MESVWDVPYFRRPSTPAAVLRALVMLAVFAVSLRFPPSAVERIARLSDPDLPPQGVAYTRRVTQVWCGFFVFNGAAALATAGAALLGGTTIVGHPMAFVADGRTKLKPIA